MTNFLLAGSAIFNKLTGGTIPVFYQLAPQAQSPPFVEIVFMSGMDERTFTDKGLNTTFLVKVISDRQYPLQAIQAYGGIHDLLEDAVITFDDYNLLMIRRESIVQYQDPDRFWHVGGNYNLDIWEN